MEISQSDCYAGLSGTKVLYAGRSALLVLQNGSCLFLAGEVLMRCRTRRLMMVVCPTLLALILFVQVLRAVFGPVWNCPTISGDDYAPDKLILCANRLIALGEEKACRLVRLSDSRLFRCAVNKFRRSKNDERLALLGRMLYSYSADTAFRGPNFGIPDVPPEMQASQEWPHFPLVFVSGVPFLMVSGYLFFGISPERGLNYFERCKSNGVFTAEPFVLPSKEESRVALDNLFASDSWRRIRWEGRSVGVAYRYSETVCRGRLFQQVDRMRR